jgi:hypothetical protein
VSQAVARMATRASARAARSSFSLDARAPEGAASASARRRAASWISARSGVGRIARSSSRSTRASVDDASRVRDRSAEAHSSALARLPRSTTTASRGPREESRAPAQHRRTVARVPQRNARLPGRWRRRRAGRRDAHCEVRRLPAAAFELARRGECRQVRLHRAPQLVERIAVFEIVAERREPRLDPGANEIHRLEDPMAVAGRHRRARERHRALLLLVLRASVALRGRAGRILCRAADDEDRAGGGGRAATRGGDEGRRRHGKCAADDRSVPAGEAHAISAAWRRARDRSTSCRLLRRCRP